MIRFEAAQLMRLQQGERCLHSGKQRGTEDQNRDGTEYDGESRATHLFGGKSRPPCMAFSGRRRVEDGRGPSEALLVRGLLIL